MNQKTCVVTGANAGIGYETAKSLAQNGADVLMICRNKEKGELALKSIQKETGSNKIKLIVADLASQSQIREAAALIREMHPVVDVLVNNAGTWFSELSYTEDNIESVFAVNHLAYVLLTHQLYPALKAAPEARIVNVSSDSHFNGKIDFNNLFLKKGYNGLKSYAQSKLGNVLFTYEFDRRRPDRHIAMNALQPGLVKTDIGLKHTKWLHSLVWKLRRSGGVSPEEGAQTSIYLATSPEAKNMSGKYWDKCQPKPSSPITYDLEVAQKLWDISLELCGIRDFFSHP